MKFDRLVVLLPCQSLESFDLQRQDGRCRAVALGVVGLVAPAAAGQCPGHSPLAAGSVPAPGPVGPPGHPARLLRAIAAGRLASAGRGSRGMCAAEPAAPRRHAGRRPGTARRRPAEGRSRPGGRFPGLGVLPLSGGTADSQAAVHEQPRRGSAADGRPGGGRRSPPRAMPRPRAHISNRPSTGCTKPASTSTRRGPAARPDVGGAEHFGGFVAGGTLAGALPRNLLICGASDRGDGPTRAGNSGRRSSRRWPTARRR